MASKPWYRTGKRAWFVTLEGRQYNLGISDPSDLAAAEAALRALLIRLGTPTTAPKTVADVVAAFLADAAGRVSAKTADSYRYYLTPFVEQFGKEAFPLRPEPIESWSRKPSWSQSTRHNALRTVSMVCSYAGHPIRLRIPAKTSAGSERVLSYADYLKLLEHTTGDFRQLIRFLWATGCRPSEATRANCEQVGEKVSVILLHEHKNSAKAGKPRTIFLVGEAVAVVSEQLEKYPQGPLFRGQVSGKPFTLHGLVNLFGHLSKRSGVKVAAYSFRHSFACRALSQGFSDAHVAALLGHTNTAMIHKHYGHLSEQARVLREVAERIRDSA